jgi:hypothetical protein
VGSSAVNIGCVVFGGEYLQLLAKDCFSIYINDNSSKIKQYEVVLDMKRRRKKEEEGIERRDWSRPASLSLPAPQ